jgi:uncharacterized protein (TIGR03437 family)
MARNTVLGLALCLLFCHLAFGDAPTIPAGGVLNFASFRAPLVAGSLGVIFGQNLAASTVMAVTRPLPTVLQGTRVVINNIPAPLFFVSPSQINFQVPWELAGVTTPTLVVSSTTGVSAPYALPLATFAPAIFSTNWAGSGQGVIFNPDLTANGTDKPARPGDEVRIACLGLGVVYNQPASGAMASLATSDTKTAPIVTIGGLPAPVVSSRLSPPGWWFGGTEEATYQVVAQVPLTVTPGNAVPVVVTIGGVSSNTVTMAIGSRPACSYTVTPATQSMAASGGTGKLTVTAGAGCDWTASSSAAWITLASGASGSGNGTANYSVAANGSASSRSATLTVAGQTVTVNQSAAPATFSVSLTGLSFSATAGTSTVASQQITVSSTLTGLTFKAEAATASGSGWLLITPGTGSVPGIIVVSVNLTGLAAGSYKGTITVQVAAASPPAQTVLVDLTVTPALPPQLTVEPLSLTFETQPGAGDPRPKMLAVGNAGGGVLNWTAQVQTSDGNPWLAVAPTSGAAPGSSSNSVQVTASAGGLKAGMYAGTVRLQCTDTGESRTVAVTLRIVPVSMTTLLSQTALIFTGVEGGELVPSQTFGIVNIGQGVMAWKAEASTLSGGNWLQVTPASGSSDAFSLGVPEVEVGINLAGMQAGRYSGLIRIGAPDADNSPQYVALDLVVLPRGSDPGVQIRPTGVIFAMRAGSLAPSPQNIRLATARPGRQEMVVGTLTFDGTDWLRAQPASSSLTPAEPRLVAVQPVLASLTAGVRRGAATFLFSDGGSQTVNVLFLVVGSAGSSSSTMAPAAVLAAADDGVLSAAADCSPTRLLAINRSLPNSYVPSAGWTGGIEVQVVDDCANPVTDANVVATFSNGDQPLSLASLRTGIYSATWRPLNATGRVTVNIRAAKSPLAEAQVAPVQVEVPANAAASAVFDGGAVNGASFAERQPLAPGTIISLFGRKLAADAQAANLPLPSKLGGSTLVVGGIETPLFFTASGQINAQLPFELPPNSRPQLIVKGADFVTVPETITVAAARPGIFTTTQDGKGQGVIMDAANRLVDAANPAKAGDVVVVYCTGLGATNPAVRSGEAAPSSPLAKVVTPVTVAIGGQPGAVQFAGLTPGYVGLYQVNVQIPGGITPGPSVPLVISQDGVPSNTVTLAVR